MVYREMCREAVDTCVRAPLGTDELAAMSRDEIAEELGRLEEVRHTLQVEAQQLRERVGLPEIDALQETADRIRVEQCRVHYRGNVWAVLDRVLGQNERILESLAVLEARQ